MKKSLLALAAFTAFTGVASAQSSVTLFGIVDLAARNVKNGSQSIKSLSTNGMSSSRLGFRGVEDLGGGLRAGFWIEGDLSADVGGGTASTGAGAVAGGQTWVRRSTLSLMGGFGEVRLGRDLTPSFLNHVVFDPFATVGVGSQLNLIVQQGQTSPLAGGAATLVRASNSIGYFLPALGGLYGQVQLAAGEGTTGNKYIGGRIGYAAGPVNVAAAVGKTEINGTTDMNAMNVGASFNMGFMTLMGQWHKYKVDFTAPTVDIDQTNYVIAAVVPFGASTLKASYGKANSTGTSRDGTQMAVGYQYSMSKRTTLYTHLSRISNGAGARYQASNAGPAFSATPGLTAASKPSSQAYEFGINHTF